MFSRDEVDGYVLAECVDIPGCMSQGKTEAEANSNIMKAIEACVSVMLQDAIAAGRPDDLNLPVRELTENVKIVSLPIPHPVEISP